MRILKALLFYPLMLMRGIFLRVVHFFAGACLLFAIIGFFVSDSDIWFWAAYLAAGVVLEAIAHFYDAILLWLNPTNSELVLFQ